jgi:hypothetical protein
MGAGCIAMQPKRIHLVDFMWEWVNMKILYLLVLPLFLIACAPQPTMFGVPQDQWERLTPAQQQEVIRGYNEQQRIQQQNAPIESAIARTQIHAKHQHEGPHIWGPPSVPSWVKQ